MLRPALIAVALTAALPATAQLRVSNGWSRATAPRAATGAGYATIRNEGRRADRLVGVTSPRAARVEIHSMSMAGGVMRMRQITGGIAIPSGGTVRLAPGGNHLMLVGLKAPLAVGERVPVTFRFQEARPVTVMLRVLAAGASGPRP
ncbi:hypothetical protein SAMN06297144_2818 [Sphingomonas guangdongensis]|uniref:Copper(I)-binding protein n=1 Tax=Sphingomonas guangdongensis TaxID=1141890 RepID=A0A285R5Q3_9SPHN|nr:copper chaperone PCu(A)C [Sphingomonas guangdongensis]SOB87682.1 hypothetical protein SAMN06297144_2818 [Sphingomonas guangdongensis]